MNSPHIPKLNNIPTMIDWDNYWIDSSIIREVKKFSMDFIIEENKIKKDSTVLDFVKKIFINTHQEIKCPMFLYLTRKTVYTRDSKYAPQVYVDKCIKMINSRKNKRRSF